MVVHVSRFASVLLVVLHHSSSPGVRFYNSDLSSRDPINQRVLVQYGFLRRPGRLIRNFGVVVHCRQQCPMSFRKLPFARGHQPSMSYGFITPHVSRGLS